MPARCTRTRASSSASSTAISPFCRASVWELSRITKNSGLSSNSSSKEPRAARAAHRVAVAGGGDAEALHPQIAVAPHDLGEQPLLCPEVVVQQPARDAGLARHVVERGAGSAARVPTQRCASRRRSVAPSPESCRPVVAAHRPEATLRRRPGSCGTRILSARHRGARGGSRGGRPVRAAPGAARAGAQATIAAGDLGVVGRSAVDGGRDAATGSVSRSGLEILQGRSTVRASRAGGDSSARASATAEGVTPFGGLVTAERVRRRATTGGGSVSYGGSVRGLVIDGVARGDRGSPASWTSGRRARDGQHRRRRPARG